MYILNVAYNIIPYVYILQFKMNETESCKVACRIKLDVVSAKNFNDKIDDDYRVNM